MSTTTPAQSPTLDSAWNRYRSGGWGTLGILIAGLVAIGALYVYNLRPVTSVTCQGKTMRPGDACIVLRGGTSYTYQQGIDRQIASQASARTALIILGVVVVVLLVLLLLKLFGRVAKPQDSPGSWHGAPIQSSILMTVFTLAMGFLALYLATNLFRGEFSWLGLGMVALVSLFAIGSLVASLPSAAQLVRADGQGLWVANGRTARQIAWPSVTGVSQSGEKEGVQWVLHEGDRKTKIGPELSAAPVLGSALIADAANRRLPAALEKIQAGGEVDLGAVAVGATGLRTGSTSIDWPSIATVRFTKGNGVVVGRDGKERRTFKETALTDRPVFVGLLETLARQPG